ncbi:protein ALWAYS EARLY 3-like isoform X2 [Typha angustifolia]|uniref:protein ALWAYS EARLY 3-like isoform X2 n=1 Tax=Typha angustifolia TaxID=59011 RepID=UPI003C2F547C
MASTRKSRNVNKRFAKFSEDWPDKDATTANKSRMRKKKLSDMLGSQWSKEELERFYEAYRKYGKDWRKVAAAIRNRSTEMVEALYNMNKAYLSLPEGTATAAGLIAMMTDHYNILEGSNSDHESNDVSKSSRKPQKRGRGKLKLVSKGSDPRYPDLLQYQSTSSSYGCLSLLKKKRSGGARPHAVGKRTPRIPVSSMYNRDDKDKIISLDKQVTPEVNATDDEGAHVAALALAEVFQRGGSPQVSRTPGRRVDQMRSSPIKSGEKKGAESEMESSKLLATDGYCPEGSVESREAENVDYARDISYLMDNDSAGPVESEQKLKRSQRKRTKEADRGNDEFDDDREACSGTEEGLTSRKVKDETDIEVTDGKRGSKMSRKRSRQLFFGDESSALDALQTLADLSVNILQPASAVESESSAQVKEEKKDIDSDGRPNVPESSSTNYQRDNSRMSLKKDKKHSESIGSGFVARRNAKSMKGLQHDESAISEMKQQTCACSSKREKRKRKSLTENISKAEFDSDSQKVESQKIEVPIDEGKRSSSKVRRVGPVSPLSKQGKQIKPQENSLSTDLGLMDMTETTVLATAGNQVNVVTKNRSRRKIGLQKALAWKEFKSSESNGDHRPDKFSHSISRAIDLKEKLSHCLSSRILRRWCVFEWFYSAIDYPWFAKSEFVEYLNHVRLGHVPRLTRVEWGVIRSSLGKPRRLSKQFLQEEREKLVLYRESVRTHYAELLAGVREGLPTDLARPLSVGQRVIACHPKTREVHDGSVLTVDRDRCRVQFDRPELGVEFVTDIDCMPLNPLENIPEALRRQNIVMNKFCNSFLDTKLDDRSKEWKIGGAMEYASGESLESAHGTSHVASYYPMNTLMKQAKGDTIDAIVQAKATVNEVAVAAQQAMYNQPCTLSQIQEREADIRALAELSRALDKKEALLIELRHMNEEVSGTQKDGDIIRDLEHFRKQYAMVLVQLRDANDQVASALLSLRQRNTYNGNLTHQWTRPIENQGVLAGPPESLGPSAFLNQDSGSQVVEIVETSRRRARMMVDAAVQAMYTIKDGEDAFVKIGEALDCLNTRSSGSGSSILGIRRIPPDSGYANSAYQDTTMSSAFEPATAQSLSPKPPINYDTEVQLPSELISSCVATMIMIQTCSERQYPPAEIAHILDSAVTSLRPCCAQNLPIFREIETCMGIIKNQMLALVPTPSTISPSEVSIV